MSDDQDTRDAQLHQLMEERLHACVEALMIARAHGTPEEVLMTLAYECGAANEFYREIRT